MVLTYDKQKLAKGPQTWGDFWDVKAFPCKRGLHFGPKGTLEIALMADGVPAADVYKVLASDGGVDRAFRKLDEIKSSIVWWKLGAESQQLAAGDVSMTAASNGRVVAANCGTPVPFPSSTISPSSREARTRTPRRNLSPLRSPRRPAQLSQIRGYGPPNLPAFDGMDPNLAAELPTESRLNASTFRDDQFWLDHNDELTQRFNVWAAR